MQTPNEFQSIVNQSENTQVSSKNTIKSATQQVVNNVETIQELSIPPLTKFWTYPKKMGIFWDILREKPWEIVSFEELQRDLNTTKASVFNIVSKVRKVLPSGYSIASQTGKGYKLLIEDVPLDEMDAEVTGKKVNICLDKKNKTIIVWKRICKFSEQEFEFLRILFHSDWCSITRGKVSKILPTYDMDVVVKGIGNTFTKHKLSTIEFFYYKHENNPENDRFMISTVFSLKISSR